jgi:hypothetical protein
MSAREPLYQGTTLVVPGSGGEDEALATAAFLFFNVSTQLSPDQKLPFPQIPKICQAFVEKSKVMTADLQRLTPQSSQRCLACFISGTDILNLE